MRKRIVFLSAAVLVVLAFGGSAQAATTISVNFGQSSFDLALGDTAGVVPVNNWNNGDTAGGATISNLYDSTHTGTGVNLTYVGGSITNNVNLTSSGSSANNKMMSHYWDSENGVLATNLNYSGGTAFFQSLANVSPFGPPDNTAVFSNLNAKFPNGYNVYVYVSGANTTNNEFAGANPSNIKSAVSPVQVAAGPSNLISTIETGNTTAGGGQTIMSFGPDNPGRGGLSMENLANLPAGTQRTILYPAVLKPSGGAIPAGSASATGIYNTAGGTYTGGQYYSADFQGFVPGTLNVKDNYPLDYGSPNGWGQQVTDNVPAVSDWPFNSVYAAMPVWDPAFRNIPLSNYIEFTNMSFDTLDILAAQIQGARDTTSGSTGQILEGGITGIQIVGIESGGSGVPEPSTLILAASGFLGLGLLVWRRRRV